MGYLALTDVSEAHQNTVSGSGSERTRGGVSKLPSLAAGRACSRRRLALGLGLGLGLGVGLG